MLIVRGFAHPVPGRAGTNFYASPKLRLTSATDWRHRRKDETVVGIVLHTRLGLPVKLKTGAGPNRGWDVDLAARFSKDPRAASAHVGIDADGSYGCFADLDKVATYHAGHVNGISVGIECYQEPDGTVYETTVQACADIIDVLTRVFGIQRQYPVERAICRRFANILPGDPHTYMPGGARGRDWCGVYGHRNVTRNRGAGDPGDEVFAELKQRGYEGFSVDEGEDITAWAKRQRELGIDERDVDGVPDLITRRYIALKRRGGPGLWVERPGDEDVDSDRLP